MSADNWAECPKCKMQAKADYMALQEKVKEAYGKVESEEYLRLVKEAAKEIKPENQLREDYELGISGSEFYVRYGAQCYKCNWSYEFTTDIDIGENIDAPVEGGK